MAIEGVREASREVDTRGAWGVKTAKNKDKPILPKKMIKRGETTKNEVLAMLSIPEEKTSDDRFFLYRLFICCATTCEICIMLAIEPSQILSNLERAWELTGGSEDQLLSTMMQISQVVAQQIKRR